MMISMPITLCQECDNFVWDHEYDDDARMCYECVTGSEDA